MFTKETQNSRQLPHQFDNHARKQGFPTSRQCIRFMLFAKKMLLSSLPRDDKKKICSHLKNDFQTHKQMLFWTFNATQNSIDALPKCNFSRTFAMLFKTIRQLSSAVSPKGRQKQKKTFHEMFYMSNRVCSIMGFRPRQESHKKNTCSLNTLVSTEMKLTVIMFR